MAINPREADLQISFNLSSFYNFFEVCCICLSVEDIGILRNNMCFYSIFLIILPVKLLGTVLYPLC